MNCDETTYSFSHELFNSVRTMSFWPVVVIHGIRSKSGTDRYAKVKLMDTNRLSRLTLAANLWPHSRRNACALLSAELSRFVSSLIFPLFNYSCLDLYNPFSRYK